MRQPQQPATAAPTRAKQPQTLRSLEEPGHPFAGLLVLPRDRTTVIEGTPLFLADLLKNHRSPAVRRPLLHAYWKLAALLVECAFLAQRETEIQAWLAQFRASNTGNNYIKAQIDILEAASRRAAAERNIRELEFVQKQYELAQLLNPGFLVSSPQDTSKLPIPCDYPLVTAYLTRIDKMPGVTQRARLLDRLITMQYKKIPECLTAQAAASDYSLVLLNQETQSRMHDTLVAYDQWLNTRIATTQVIADYNCLIADFTAETVGGDQSLEELLKAHIKLAPAVSEEKTVNP